MDSLTEILKIGGGIGATLVVLITLVKSGLLQIKVGKNGNGQTPHDENVTRIERNETDIQKLFSHAEIANREMSEIKVEIVEIKSKVENIKESQERMEKAINGIYNRLNKE